MGGRAGQRTVLAAGAPAAAAPAAALGPGDGLAPARLSLARGLRHLREAGPLPDVWGEQVEMTGGRNKPLIQVPLPQGHPRC